MLIGLTGAAGVGKDTVGDILQRTYDFSRYSMAGPLKAALAAMGFPEPPREFKESQIDGFEFTWRKAAQTLGTEWGRSLQEDLWLKMAEREINKPDNFDMVITDIRFPNEADLIHRYGGILVRVSGRATTVVGAAAHHPSEQGLARVDYVLDNSGSIGNLHDAVFDMVNCYKGSSK